MGNLVDEIVSVIQASLVNGAAELQQELKLESLPVMASEGTVAFTIPKSQKLDNLLNQPNHTRVSKTERKKKDGTTVSVRSHKRKTPKTTLAKAVEACEADEADTQQGTDAISKFIKRRIQQGLGNLKSASL